MIVIQSRTRPTISLVIFSITAVATGLLVFLLPETENRPLPETVQEIEAWSNNNSNKILNVPVSANKADNVKII